jgi:hypothetical protein
MGCKSLSGIITNSYSLLDCARAFTDFNKNVAFMLKVVLEFNQ